MEKLLLIGPEFFGYTDRICVALSQYFIVDKQYTFNPGHIFNRYDKSGKMIKYYDSLKVEDTYDIVLVINGKFLPSSYLEKLKDKNLNTRFILYLWDDYKNVNHPKSFIHLFDTVYSYSKKDSEMHEELTFQPFFFSEATNCKKYFDLSFIGSMHSNRLQIFNEYSNLLGSNDFLYLYSDPINFLKLPSNWRYFSKVNFRKLKYEDYIDVLAKSKITLEVTHKNQENITTRAIEALGVRTKLITNSCNIKDFDFYLEENIFVIDDNNISQLKKWSTIPYKEIDKEIFEKYSINSWSLKVTKNE